MIGKIMHAPILEALHRAEKITDAEICVHVSRNPFRRNIDFVAKRLFFRLKLHHSEHNHAVLLYFNIWKRRYCFYADKQSYAFLKTDFLNALGQKFAAAMKERDFNEAVAHCIDALALELAKHFQKT